MSDIKSDVVQNINRFYTTGAVECLNLIGWWPFKGVQLFSGKLFMIFSALSQSNAHTEYRHTLAQKRVVSGVLMILSDWNSF